MNLEGAVLAPGGVTGGEGGQAHLRSPTDVFGLAVGGVRPQVENERGRKTIEEG